MARNAGWKADGLHLNLEFARLIDRQRYEALCQHRGTLLSEWLFAEAAFGMSGPALGPDFLNDSTFDLTKSTFGMDVSAAKDWLWRVRRTLVPAFLDVLVDTHDWQAYDIVAFTSTFQQNVASFALSRKLKDRFPHLTSLFGGANFDGEMGLEYMRSVECIDFAAIGEADTSFPAFLNTFRDGGDLATIPGIAVRVSNVVQLKSEAVPFQNLDSLPIPDYADYFDRAERLGFLKERGQTEIDLPFESARGCWWGQKHHCIFCGLNAKTMAFRSKSPERVLDELTTLSSRYRSLSLEAVDNILDVSYLKTLMPRIAEKQLDWNIFYETKSNLSVEDLLSLSQAGVKRLQPGIESLNTELLRTMRKGITGIRNINLLKWCRALGITVSWNFLWGFPGESAENYAEQIPKLIAISHLQPPDGEGRLWLERFSPMFNDRESLGVNKVKPLGSYSYVYPPNTNLEKAAYFFEYEMAGALPDSEFAEISLILQQWRDAWKSDNVPFLRCKAGPDFIRIDEGRPGRARGEYVFDGVLAAVYMSCMRRPMSLSKIAETTGQTESVVETALTAFDEHALVIREGNSSLALATQ